jgi:hypothetical protein
MPLSNKCCINPFLSASRILKYTDEIRDSRKYHKCSVQLYFCALQKPQNIYVASCLVFRIDLTKVIYQNCSLYAVQFEFTPLHRGGNAHTYRGLLRVVCELKHHH